MASKTHTEENPSTAVCGPVRTTRLVRKTPRQHFCDGLEAALKGEPDSVAATRPRTMLGLMVQNLVLEASRARPEQIKLVFAFLEQAAVERSEREAEEGDDDSQGISGAGAASEPQWDWDEKTGWDSSRRGEDDLEREQRIAREACDRVLRENPGLDANTGALSDQLRQRYLRAAEADRENLARLATRKQNVARGGAEHAEK
ncbi:MAG TPA: hypothetical protein VHX61_07505 [Rhizomicrobium sp.]|nr:hypothetical protein [Rhizomicrobium sp.]